MVKTLIFLLSLIALTSSQLWARDLQKTAPLEAPLSVSFGAVSMGEVARTTFVLKNLSNEELTIESIISSCGCSTAQAERDVIPASGNVVVTVIVDTAQKLGEIKKTLRISLANYRLPVIVSVEGQVSIPSMHHEGVKGVKLFSEKCISCHSKQGEGRQGLPLYLADCAMCHGTARQGSSAPALLAFRPDWMTTIRNGRIAMTAFAHNHGGPLSEDQLASLQAFLEGGVIKKKGGSGFRLYYENCSPCHGEMRMGPIGPDIRLEKLAHLPKEELRKLLVEGTKNPMMPSFWDQKKGWLTSEEIDLIVDYLKGE